MRWQIVRFHFDGENEERESFETEEEAKEHCKDPETSSSTASPETLARFPGTWFDGYTDKGE